METWFWRRVARMGAFMGVGSFRLGSSASLETGGSSKGRTRTGRMRPMSDSGLASALPEPPYYAVIFSSRRTSGDHGYGAMAERMVALAQVQPGFLGIESVRDAEGLGITV